MLGHNFIRNLDEKLTVGNDNSVFIEKKPIVSLPQEHLGITIKLISYSLFKYKTIPPLLINELSICSSLVVNGAVIPYLV